jgi:hypothetical protein
VKRLGLAPEHFGHDAAGRVVLLYLSVDIDDEIGMILDFRLLARLDRDDADDDGDEHDQGEQGREERFQSGTSIWKG